MNRAGRCILLCVLLALCGCAARGTGTALTTGSKLVATRPAADTRARLTLDQIEPKPLLSATQPATQPTEPAPLGAIELYAQARAAILDNQRFSAIILLEKAIALDPYSFELQYALGQAYFGTGSATDKGIAALEKAAHLRPDDLDVQLQLGRQYFAKGDAGEAIDHLRLALQTPEYKQEEDSAAVVDFHLARALQQQGYARAALDQYGVLLDRLQRPNFSMRANPELMFLANRPESLYVQIGELHEKLGNLPDALKAYGLAARTDEGNFELQAKVIRTLLGLNRGQEARQRALDLAARLRASPDSLGLVREAYQSAGGEVATINDLSRLHRQRPTDRGLLFVLTQMMASSGHQAEAENLLSAEVVRTSCEFDVVDRLFDLYIKRDDVESAARLLVEAAASRPQSLRDLAPLWSQLLAPSRKNRLRLGSLEVMQVQPQAEGSKRFWVSRVADLWNRDVLARTSLEQSVRFDPPFPPAFRSLLGQYWMRSDWDDAQKVEASNRLADDAAGRNRLALAAELRGLSLLNQKKPIPAIDALTQAVRLGGTSPDLQLTLATAQFAQGNVPQAEQILWKLVSDWPTYEDAYAILFQHYAGKGSPNQALKVLTTWLSADAQNVHARLLQASVYLQGKRFDLAEKVILGLFKDNSDDAEVLKAMEALYTQTGRVDELITKLESERQRQPENRGVVEWLVATYAGQKRLSEASRVLDGVRAAVAKDPDLLYYVAHLYTRIDQKQTTEQVLQQVVQLDPSHAGASNDLGYSWADEGKNLDRAESLIRVAVAAEPDNQSFLDSLGWVLYKRGRFEEAHKYLDLAIGPAARPDPVVLDHLGDVLYRLGQQQDAAKQWRRSLERLGQVGPNRDDLKQLQLQLTQKLKQSDQKQPVQAAPVVETTTKPVQAKN